MATLVKMSRLGVIVSFCSFCVFGSPVSLTLPVVTEQNDLISICEFVECPQVNCESPMRTEGQCCAICPGEKRSKCVSS